MYQCTCMYVEGHICQVVSLKSGVCWGQSISKNLCWGLPERLHFCQGKNVMDSEVGSLLMDVYMYIKSERHLQSHRIAEVGRDLSRSCSPTTLLKARSSGPGCPRLCAVGFWRWMETPQLLWLHSFSVQCSFCTVREMNYWYSEIHRNFPVVTAVVTNLFKLFAHQ